jgi:hypothetical protein
LEHPTGDFLLLDVPMVLIGTLNWRFSPSRCSNGPYWNIQQPIFSFPMFQSPLLEHSTGDFLLLDVPIDLIGTLNCRFSPFRCSNHPYWNTQLAIFSFSMSQSTILEHSTGDFLLRNVPILSLPSKKSILFRKVLKYQHPIQNSLSQEVLPAKVK